jgi:hypothetical protein
MFELLRTPAAVVDVGAKAARVRGFSQGFFQHRFAQNEVGISRDTDGELFSTAPIFRSRVRVPPPAVIECTNFAWPRSIEKTECVVENGELLSHMEWLTQRMA